MKKYLILLLLIFSSSIMFSQPQKCYTDPAHQYYSGASSLQKDIYRKNEAAVQSWIAAHRNDVNRTGSVVTIPVVFHIVYKNATQDIADSNIYRQVAVLNECFRLQNSNFNQTRPIFDSIAADVEIEFCLANVDPSGAPTTGISRTQAPAGTFFDPLLGMDNVKSDASGGKSPWPNDQYLNIWVCDMSLFGLTVVLGYATFPGGDPLLDGVVIQYQFVGFMNNPTTNNQGKTTVHEVGHWLGLRHIWGDGQLSTPLCDSTDYVDDTPNADEASQQTCDIKNTCSNESPYWTSAGIDPPDMVENYMDYSYDDCMTMFTSGQKTRMLGFLNTTRTSLLTSNGCNTVGLSENNDYNFSIAPNPVSDNITINTTYTGYFDLVIFDVTGRQIKKINQLRNVVNIDLSDVGAGILLYEIRDNTKIIHIGKLVKL